MTPTTAPQPPENSGAIATVGTGTSPHRLRRIAIGDCVVVPLSDGTFTMDLSGLTGVTPARVGEVQRDAGLPADAMTLPVYAFLLQGPHGTLLVDAGTAPGMMTSLGRLPESLRAAGVEAIEIEDVLITHMHPDHIGGVVDAEGRALFPSATIHIAEAEWDYWMHPARGSADPATAFIVATNTRSIGPYAAAGRIRLFAEGETLVPGLTARALPGHTPGHTGFELVSGNDRMLFWGDALHLVPLQIECPGCGLAHDIDPSKGERTRLKVIGELERSGYLIAGAHVPAPGVGRIVEQGKRTVFMPLGDAGATEPR